MEHMSEWLFYHRGGVLTLNGTTLAELKRDYTAQGFESIFHPFLSLVIEPSSRSLYTPRFLGEDVTKYQTVTEYMLSQTRA